MLSTKGWGRNFLYGTYRRRNKKPLLHEPNSLIPIHQGIIHSKNKKKKENKKNGIVFRSSEMS
jgi:hypothetical protein